MYFVRFSLRFVDSMSSLASSLGIWILVHTVAVNNTVLEDSFVPVNVLFLGNMNHEETCF